MKKSDLAGSLSGHRQIHLTVTGRKSGKEITMPVWFVAEGEELFLLPVHGSDTQWFKNVRENPQIHVQTRGTEALLEVKPITQSETVKSVIQKFREKYGTADVRRYYSKFDVAIIARLT